MILPAWTFGALIWGALGLAGLGAGALFILFVRDIRSGSTW